MAEINSEKKTLIVILLTLVTMFAEIIVGYLTNSMALFADGCHMGTHALALSLTFLTYVLIRKFSDSQSFVFGTGKFSVLSGFTSSVLLGITGIFIIKEAFERYFNPLDINLNEAILVAIIGFAVNLLCIVIMGEKEHCHGCCEYSHNEDYNFKAAYLHILADLMTSVFAIGALLAAKCAGWNFLDPIVGLLGGIVILIWAVGLIKSTSMILLDAEVLDLKTEIEEHLENKFKFDELHVWKTSENEYALILRVSSGCDLDKVKSEISNLAEFSFMCIENSDNLHN
jgi:cation diffusion facilitator family transporter